MVLNMGCAEVERVLFRFDTTIKMVLLLIYKQISTIILVVFSN